MVCGAVDSFHNEADTSFGSLRPADASSQRLARRLSSDTLHVARIHPRRSSTCSAANGGPRRTGDLSDPFRDPPPVLRLEVESLEEQQVQNALRKVDARQRFPRRFYRSILAVFPVEVQGRLRGRQRNPHQKRPTCQSRLISRVHASASSMPVAYQRSGAG